MYLWRFYGSLLNDCDFWSSCFYSNSNMDKVLSTIHCVSKSSYETSSFKFTAEQLTTVLSFHHIVYQSLFILRRPQNIAKSPTYFCPQYIQTKVMWRFCKILWSSQNIWTLLDMYLKSLSWPSFTFSADQFVALQILTSDACNFVSNLTSYNFLVIWTSMVVSHTVTDLVHYLFTRISVWTVSPPWCRGRVLAM